MICNRKIQYNSETKKFENRLKIRKREFKILRFTDDTNTLAKNSVLK